MDAAEDAGVEMLLNSGAFDAIVEDGVVRGVAVATPTGPVAVLGKAVIDATGDGDVAAFAGAECVLGSEREHLVMYALMPEGDRPGRFLNVKTSMLDVTDVEDVTRMVLVERRRHRGSPHDHGIYLAPRESRHVRGGVTLTLSDQLLETLLAGRGLRGLQQLRHEGADDVRLAPDGPAVAEPGDRDPLPRAAAARAGGAHRRRQGLLGHARCHCRAPHAAGPGEPGRRGRPRRGHGRARGRGAGERWTCARSRRTSSAQTCCPSPSSPASWRRCARSDDELRALIAGLDGRTPLSEYSNAEVGTRFEGRVPIVDVLCAGPRVVPLLEEALVAADGPRRTLLAQALAAVGSRAGVPALVEEIERQLAGGSLPGCARKVRHAGMPPNQCAAPDAAYLLYSLGMARDERALPVWGRVVELLDGTTTEEMFDRTLARYFYVDAVCYGAERLGDRRAVPLLERLHGYGLLRGRVLREGREVDWFQERLAHLELVIGRALARCGSRGGYAVLIDYLDDVRAILVAHARSELAAIAGRDEGRDAAAWRRWLAEQPDPLPSVPWTRADGHGGRLGRSGADGRGRGLRSRGGRVALELAHVKVVVEALRLHQLLVACPAR